MHVRAGTNRGVALDMTFSLFRVVVRIPVRNGQAVLGGGPPQARSGRGYAHRHACIVPVAGKSRRRDVRRSLWWKSHETKTSEISICCLIFLSERFSVRLQNGRCARGWRREMNRCRTRRCRLMTTAKGSMQPIPERGETIRHISAPDRVTRIWMKPARRAGFPESVARAGARHAVRARPCRIRIPGLSRITFPWRRGHARVVFEGKGSQWI